MKKKPIVIAIASVSGGGKTTVSKALVLHNVKVFHFDDYEMEGPEDIVKWANESGNHHEWNIEPMRQDVLVALKDENLHYVILDYPFSYLHDQMKDFIDISIYIDTPLDIAMARRFLREPATSIEEMIDGYKWYLQAGRKAYEVMEDTIKPNADYIMDGKKSVEEIAQEILQVAVYHHEK